MNVNPSTANPGAVQGESRQHVAAGAPALNGLTSAEAAERLKQYGPNRLRPALQRAVVLQFLAQFRNPLVLILLVASGVSALTGDVTGALIIGVIVVMSVTLDFVQAYRAGRAAERLALQVAVTATVLRDAGSQSDWCLHRATHRPAARGLPLDHLQVGHIQDLDAVGCGSWQGCMRGFGICIDLILPTSGC